MADPATTVMERCNILGGVSEEPDPLIRPYGSEAMRRANALVAGRMQAAGMVVRQDEIGNFIGRYGGREEGEGTLRVVVTFRASRGVVPFRGVGGASRSRGTATPPGVGDAGVLGGMQPSVRSVRG